ncbi:MAG: efflux RND transporter permease subunit [Leadbetterella sp.]
MSLTEIAIKRPSLIIVMFTILIGGGMLAYTKLSYELLPDFSQSVITITTPYPGASAAEVEEQVSKKLEDAVSGLENIDEVNSKSIENASLVFIWFKYGTDLDKAIQDAQRKIDNIKSDLPSEIKTPIMSKISPNDQPILQVSANSSWESKEFRQKLEDEIIPKLQQAKGVAEITLLGGEQREIRINVDKNKLQSLRIPIMAISQAISQANLEFPTGKLKNETEQITVRLSGKFNSIDQIKKLIIATPPNGSPIYLQDVARVEDDIADRASFFRYNGKDGIGIIFKKQADANAVDMAKGLKEKLKDIEKLYAKNNVKFKVSDDTSLLTIESVDSVLHDLEIAIILVAIVMLLFLHSIRSSIIVLVAIPASLISTFIAMWMLGYTLNLMTLLAMSLVIGILVDDSIVVLENIFRHLEMGKDKRTAALDGRNEIGFTALAITFVDVVVFTPILFTSTTISQVLQQFSIVVVISTLMSLLVCFTLTPWLASRFAQLTHLNKRNPLHWVLIQFEKGVESFTMGYVQLVNWCLKNKIITGLFIVSLFVILAQIMGMGIMGQEFISEGDQGKMILNLKYDKKTTLVQNNLNTRKVEAYLLTQPDIISVFANVGGPKNGLGGTGQGDESQAEITILREPSFVAKTSTPKRLLQIRSELEKQFAGVEFTGRNAGLIASNEAPINLIFAGENREQLLKEAIKMKGVIEKIPGAKDVDISSDETTPEVKVEVDREKMAKLGLDMATVGVTLQNAFTGNDKSQYREEGSEYDIRIMLDAFDRKNVYDVSQIPFTNQQGQTIKLEQFAQVTQDQGSAMLERKNRRNMVQINAYVSGIGTGTLAEQIDDYLAKNPLPEGLSIAWDGDIKRQGESFGALGMSMGIALILVYLIMVLLYDDFVYPFVVLFSIPVAIIGALLALNLAGANMGIFTGLGMIMLLGLVAKNAILIVDFTNHLKTTGVSTHEALLEAIKERMRPILMTTLAMVIGMIPLAFGTGAASAWKSGMAWVLIGGLTSSMILTIIVVPVIYTTVDNLKAFFGKFRRKEALS